MKFSFSGTQDIYLEIAERYQKYIEQGILRNGEKLPSVRQAAMELSVNPNTVAKAYAKLEQEGYICSLPKKGVYVTYEDRDNRAVENEDFARICDMHDRGISKQTILCWIEEVYGND